MIWVVATPENGVISGGWEFVWAAYGLTWLFFGIYSATLFARAPRASEEER